MASCLSEGGNDRWWAVWQTGGGADFQFGVVAFDGDEEIRTVFLIGLPQSLLTGMEGVEHEQLAVEWAELYSQLSGSRDFVALVLVGDSA